MTGSIALTDGKAIAAALQLGVPKTHSANLIPSIDHLLAVAGWRASSIDGIAVAVGPGSFIGLRIGVAAAKGMALALGRPVVGVSSLEALAMNGRHFAGIVVPLIDAKRGEVYASAYESDGSGEMRRAMDEAALSPEALAERLEGMKSLMLFLGDGASAYWDRISERLGERASIAVGGMLLPHAANLAILALPALEAGEGRDPASLVPNYVRRSDAEIGFKGKAMR